MCIRDRIDADALRAAAKALLDSGVRELVVIHFPEGGFAARRNGETMFVPSFVLEPGEIKGTAGAGDAFCAGMLYAVHGSLPLADALSIANAAARFNLLSPTCTDGAVSLDVIDEYRKHAPIRAVI